MTADERLLSKRFPRASTYDPEWVIASASGGANAVWLTEWVAEALDLRPGMRVLDLGCGRATSSIFLCREFGVQVWAIDLWFSASQNLQRIRDAGVESGVFPIHADARSLPFAAEFFDGVVCIDSYGARRALLDAPARRTAFSTRLLNDAPARHAPEQKRACRRFASNGHPQSAHVMPRAP